MGRGRTDSTVGQPMTDFATLVLGADTSGLKRGEDALNRIPAVAAKAEKATDKVGDSFKRSGDSADKSRKQLSDYDAALQSVSKAIGGQVASFDDLRRAVDPAYAAQQKWTEIQKVSAAAVAAGEASQREANIVLQEAARRYMGVVPAAEAAAEAQRKNADQQKALRAAYEATRASLDPLYASSKRYEQIETELNAALRAGVVTQREHAKALDLAASRYIVASDGAQDAAKATVGLSKSFAMGGNDAKMLAYQFSQIAQQGAATGQYLQAMTIQAADIGAAFGVVGIAIGSVISALGPMAGAMLSTSSSADDLTDTTDDMTDAVRAYSDAVDAMRLSSADMRQEFGSGSEAMRMVLQDLAAIGNLKAYRDIDETTDALKELVLSVAWWDDRTAQSAAQDFLGVGNFSEKARQAGAEFEAILELMAQSEEPAVKLAAALDLRDTLLANSGGIENMTEQQDEFYQGLLSVIRDLDIMGVKVEEAAAPLGGMTDDIREMVADYERQAALQGQIALLGEDSAMVEALRRQEVERQVMAMADQEGLAEDVAAQVRDAALAAYDAQVNATNAANSLRDAETAARGLASAIASAAGFSANLDNGVRVLEAEISALQSGADAAIASTIEGMKIKAEANRADQIAAGQDAIMANAQYAIDMAAIERQEALLAQKKELTAASRSRGSAAKSASKAASKAMNDEAKAAEALAKAIEAAEFDADPVKKYNAQVKELDALLKGGLSDRAYQHALEGFNDELANSLPLVQDVTSAFSDFLYDGARDFKSFAESVFDDFKRLIADMIATAARNKILLSLGLTSTGTAASAGTSSLVSGASSLMGGLGNTIGGLSSAISSVTGGLGVVGTALGNFATGTLASISGFMSGGFSGLAGTVSAAFANGGMATALGSVLGPIGLVAGGAALVKSLIGGSPDKTFNVEERALELFGYSQNNLTWARSVARGNDGYDGNVVSKKDLVLDGFDAAMLEAQNDLFQMVSDFGLDATGVIDAALAEAATRSKGWLLRREINLDGLSDEQKTAEILSFISDATGELAAFVPGLEAVTREGENGYEALTAMQSALQLVNGTAAALNSALLDVSLSGGAAARELIDLFGDSSAYSSAVSNYVSLFYSEAEQLEFATRSLTQTMDALGATMPTTRDQYMQMIEAADLTTESGRTLYAALVSLASQFDAVLPSVDAFSAAMQGIVGGVLTGVEAMIADTTTAQRAAERAASDWYAASRTMRTFITDLRGEMSGTSSFAALSAQYAATYEAARGGDLDAMQEFSSVASAYLEAAKGQAGTAVEYATAQARVLNQAKLLAGVSELEGATEDVTAALYERQIDVLEDLQTALTSGEEVTQEYLSEIDGSLGDIQSAIEQAQSLNYTDLINGVSDLVDAVSMSGLPEWVQNRYGEATGGLATVINLAVTDESLTPDMRWLIAMAASDNTAMLNVALSDNSLTDWQSALRARTSTALTDAITDVVNADLLASDTLLGLTGLSELARVANDVAGSDAAQRSITMALQNVMGYAELIGDAVNKAAALAEEIYGKGPAYAALIEAAFDPDLSESARRVLLDQAGDYLTLVTGEVDLSNLNRRQKALLDMVSGVVGGTVRLGGTIEFDPSSHFADWYEGATRDNIATPMEALRGSINSLKTAIAAEAAAAEAAAELARAQANAASKAAAEAAAKSTVEAVINQVKALEASTGVDIVNGGKDATLGLTNYKATNVVYSSGSDLDAFSAAFWADGGLEDQYTAAIAAYKKAIRQSNAADNALASFDGGGFTGSGPRSGGVDGRGGFHAILHPNETVVDWTKTPTSRQSSGQSNAQTEALLAEAVAELKATRAENTQLLLKIERYQRSQDKILRQWNDEGQPAERV